MVRRNDSGNNPAKNAWDKAEREKKKARSDEDIDKATTLGGAIFVYFRHKLIISQGVIEYARAS